MTAVPLTGIEPLRSLLALRPPGLFSDIDGTLSPVVDRPEDAKVTPRCRDLLRILMGNGVRVALITGRPLDVARSMVDLDGAAYAANHGLEFWVNGQFGLVAVVGEYPVLVDQVQRYTDTLAKVGVSLELKGQGLAFHYRQAPDDGMAVAEIERVINSAPVARDFLRIEGRKVIELRPDTDANKGTAARRLAGQLGVRSIISLGDDTTDVNMFSAVSALGKQGIEGVSVAVMSPEVHPDVLEAADYSVEGVEGVEWLLEEIVGAITRTVG